MAGILADQHVHTHFSGDSEASVSSILEQAVSMGMKRICFTDHLDLDYIPDPSEGTEENPFLLDLPGYVKSIQEAAATYRDRIEVRLGIELGMIESGYEEYRKLLSVYPFDFVIGSVHVVDRIDPYFPSYWSRFEDSEEGVRRYFETVHNHLMNFDQWDTCGHLDYIIRYVPQPEKRSYAYELYQDLLDAILRRIIETDRCLEVNTAGFKYGLGKPNPQPEVLKRYLELGGERITIGSDAHRPEHLAYDFGLCRELLEDLGFRYYALFDRRKPTMWKL